MSARVINYLNYINKILKYKTSLLHQLSVSENPVKTGPAVSEVSRNKPTRRQNLKKTINFVKSAHFNITNRDYNLYRYHIAIAKRTHSHSFLFLTVLELINVTIKLIINGSIFNH